tara:strand:+ start:1201 stop:1665 length:465 start_codon:yes stop_codon:yes gene_type:complete
MKSIVFIYFLFSTLLADDVEPNKFKIAFSPDFIGLGGIGPNIELFYNSYSFKTGFGMMVNTPAIPIAIYKNIPIHNKITEIIGTPEIGLGYVVYNNDIEDKGIYLCTNFKIKRAYNKGYFRYGFYYGLIQYEGYPVRKFGMIQIGVIKYLKKNQ